MYFTLFFSLSLKKHSKTGPNTSEITGTYIWAWAAGPDGRARKMTRPVGPKHTVGPDLGSKYRPDSLAGPGLGKKIERF
jgi:hypothetical protein